MVIEKNNEILWNITGKCNGKCRYCFRLDGKDVKRDEQLRMLDHMADKGAENWSFRAANRCLCPIWTHCWRAPPSAES